MKKYKMVMVRRKRLLDTITENCGAFCPAGKDYEKCINFQNADDEEPPIALSVGKNH